MVCVVSWDACRMTKMNTGTLWDVLNSRARGYGTGVPTTSEGGCWLLVFIFSNGQYPAVVLG